MFDAIYNQLPKPNFNLTDQYVNNLERDLRKQHITAKCLTTFEAAVGSLPPFADATLNLGVAGIKGMLIPSVFFTAPKGQKTALAKRRMAEVVEHVKIVARCLFMSLVGILFPVMALFQPKGVVYMGDNLSLRIVPAPVPPNPPNPPLPHPFEARPDIQKVCTFIIEYAEEFFSATGGQIEDELNKVQAYKDFKDNTLIHYLTPHAIKTIIGATSVTLGVYATFAILKRIF